MRIHRARNYNIGIKLLMLTISSAIDLHIFFPFSPSYIFSYIHDMSHRARQTTRKNDVLGFVISKSVRDFIGLMLIEFGRHSSFDCMMVFVQISR